MVLTRSKAKQESNFDREAGAHKLGSWDQFQANKDLVKGDTEKIMRESIRMRRTLLASV